MSYPKSIDNNVAVTNTGLDEIIDELDVSDLEIMPSPAKRARFNADGFEVSELLIRPVDVTTTAVDFRVQTGNGVNDYNDVVTIDENGVALGSGVVVFAGNSGSATNPQYAFDSNTGMFSNTQHEIDFTLNGNALLNLSNDHFTSERPLVLDANNTEALLVRKQADGGDVFTVNTTATSGQVLCPQGSVSSPGISFQGDTNSGFYNTGDNLLLSLGGVQALNFSGTAFALNDRDTGNQVFFIGMNNTPQMILGDNTNTTSGKLTFRGTTTSTQGVEFADSGGTQGLIQYDHATNQFTFQTGAASRLTLGSTNMSLSPLSAPSLTLNSGSALDTYIEGSHVSNWGSGLYASALSRTVNYTVVGNVVTLRFPEILGTVTSSNFLTNTTQLPETIRPPLPLFFTIFVTDNSVEVLGRLEIDEFGIVYVLVGAAASSFATGFGGMFATSISYTI